MSEEDGRAQARVEAICGSREFTDATREAALDAAKETEDDEELANKACAMCLHHVSAHRLLSLLHRLHSSPV